MNASVPASAPAHGSQFDRRRVLAGLIDLAIVGVGVMVLLSFGGVLGSDANELTPALELVATAWALFYYFALESDAGQTVGKRIMGLRVVMADGRPADMRAIAMRTVARVIDGIAFYVVGLVVMVVTGERRQRIGDMAGGTIVTSAKLDPAASAPKAAAVPAGSPVDAGFAQPSPSFEPGATVPPLPVLETPISGPETPSPVLDTAPAASPAPPAHPLPEAPSAPELKPFAPFSEAPAAEAPAVDAPLEVTPGPVVEIVDEPSVELSPDPMAGLPTDPIVEISPEPVVETAEPAADAPWQPIMGAAAETSPEEIAPVEPEAVVETADETISETDWSIPTPAPDVDDSAPADDPAADAQEESADEPMTVRRVETVSAIDLVMGELEEDEAAGPAPTA
jgi:uncharacterized RDD family membrane protein YckC